MDSRNSFDQPVGDGADRSQPTAPSGLGDLAEAFFNSVGITEDRYRAVKVALHLDPKCGCAERKKWLNEMGGS